GALDYGLSLKPEESCVFLRQGVFVIFPPAALIRIPQQAEELVKFLLAGAVELPHRLDVVGAGHGLGCFDPRDLAGGPAELLGGLGAGDFASLAEKPELLAEPEPADSRTALRRWHRRLSLPGMEV